MGVIVCGVCVRVVVCVCACVIVCVARDVCCVVLCVCVFGVWVYASVLWVWMRKLFD